MKVRRKRIRLKCHEFMCHRCNEELAKKRKKNRIDISVFVHWRYISENPRIVRSGRSVSDDWMRLWLLQKIWDGEDRIFKRGNAKELI